MYTYIRYFYDNRQSGSPSPTRPAVRRFGRRRRRRLSGRPGQRLFGLLRSGRGQPVAHGSAPRRRRRRSGKPDAAAPSVASSSSSAAAAAAGAVVQHDRRVGRRNPALGRLRPVGLDARAASGPTPRSAGHEAESSFRRERRLRRRVFRGVRQRPVSVYLFSSPSGTAFLLCTKLSARFSQRMFPPVTYTLLLFVLFVITCPPLLLPDCRTC